LNGITEGNNAIAKSSDAPRDNADPAAPNIRVLDYIKIGGILLEEWFGEAMVKLVDSHGRSYHKRLPFP
jgi:hypothetical protein